MKLKDKIQLELGFEEIRRAVADAQSPFGKRTKKQKAAMIERAREDAQYFAEQYFPHYMEAPPSKMHIDLYRKFADLILSAEESGEGSKDAEAAPRGNAKSTLASLFIPAWAICFGYRKFILLVMDTEPQAKGMLEALRAELEVNERLAEDFPEIVGPGRKWATGEFITRNNVRCLAKGKGSGMRGLRFLNRRPDLVICDDLENDEAVQSPEQRAKDENWFFRALMKCGARYTVHLVVGTVLHYDSLLSKLLKRPGWTGTIWKAVIRWSNSPLWETWENLYCDRGGGPERADRFFLEHEEEMLAGTEVLWPEQEDYYYLMKMRVSDGPAFFDSEKQNEPINPEDCLFPEEDIAIADEDEVLASIRQKKYQYYAALDPSLGKKSKGADPSALVIAGVLANGTIDVIEADIKKRQPTAQIEAIFDYDALYPYERLGIEAIQFQEFFKDTVEDESKKRRRYLVIDESRPNIDKTLRISKLQPHLRNKTIRIRAKCRTLIDQLKYFPKADHDDGPDALEQVFTLIKQGSAGPRIRRVA